MVYAARVKINKNNSALKDLFEVHAKTFAMAKVGDAAPKLTKRRLLTAIIFVLAFVLMVFAMLNGNGKGLYGESTAAGSPADIAEKFKNNKESSFFHNSSIYEKMFIKDTEDHSE